MQNFSHKFLKGNLKIINIILCNTLNTSWTEYNNSGPTPSPGISVQDVRPSGFDTGTCCSENQLLVEYKCRKNRTIVTMAEKLRACCKLFFSKPVPNRGVWKNYFTKVKIDEDRNSIRGEGNKPQSCSILKIEKPSQRIMQPNEKSSEDTWKKLPILEAKDRKGSFSSRRYSHTVELSSDRLSDQRRLWTIDKKILFID